MLTPQAYGSRPVPLRHPLVFYDGHLPAFSFNKLVREALGGPALDPALERLFERGIDPSDLTAARAHERASWPQRRQVEAFGAACDAAVLAALASADLCDAARSPLLERAEAVYTILEHEEMHHETLAYLIHRIPFEGKGPRTGASTYCEREHVARGAVAIPAGVVTLGARRNEVPFGWDSEFEADVVAVRAFSLDVDNVTNGEWLAFVKEGGPLPSFWLERGGELRYLGAFEEMPLPLSWPVYVTQAQATAYAAWRGGRLMTEAEYHRAAYGTPAALERPFPWGDEAPAERHGNFGFRRWDPEPVGSRPAGASAFGVHDLIGNGWEWTATAFGPFPGFREMASYPPYSSDFFDGAHFVLKGASPVTARTLVRRSFRNWFRADYPYVYASFRVAYD